MSALWRSSMSQTHSTPNRERIRDEIVDLAVAGEIEPGVSTSENEIARKLGGGRTPIREGLALLVTEGMFEQIPQVGVKLRSPSAAEVEKILAIRARLEGLIVEDLAVEEDPESLTATAVRTNGEALAMVADRVAFGRQAARFHGELAMAAGYETAALSIRTCMDRLRVYEAVRTRAETIRADGRSMTLTEDLRRTIAALEIVREQSAILASIHSGDPVAAGNSLAEHLERTHQRLAEDPGSGRTPAPKQVEETADLLVKNAGEFLEVGAHAAAGLAVTMLAGLCFEAGKHRDAAVILGNPISTFAQPLAASVDLVGGTFPAPAAMKTMLRSELGEEGLASALQEGHLLDLGAIGNLIREH